MAEYTIVSSDPDYYNRIHAYFDPVNTDTASMIVTSLTTHCSIKILKKSDYIKINDIVYFIGKDFTSLTRYDFVKLLNDREILYLRFDVDNCERIVLVVNGDNVTLNDASYNVRIIMGLHPFEELGTEYYGDPEYIQYYTIPTVGSMLSTPVLYLTCNIGSKTYINNSRSKFTQNSKIVMRLNNSFSPNFPIFAGNGEFITTVMSNDLTDVNFTLVDANMKEIELLNPMFLSVSIKLGAIDDRWVTMTSGVVGAMNWNERMKNKDAQMMAAELNRFDIMNQLKTGELQRIVNSENDRNSK